MPRRSGPPATRGLPWADTTRPAPVLDTSTSIRIVRARDRSIVHIQSFKAEVGGPLEPDRPADVAGLGENPLDAGQLRVLGASPQRFTATTRARIGYMPQLFVLYPELSVRQYLDLVASLYGSGSWQRRAPMRRVLELVELWDHRGKSADALSGGMQRRLELATALVHDPELHVVDEPTAGIDPILRAKLWEHFRALRDQGRTVFVTSQYVTEDEYCDRVAMLGCGRLVATGSPEDVRARGMGGETVEVVGEELDRAVAGALEALAGVRAIRPISYERLQLTVDRADLAIPRVLSSSIRVIASIGIVNFDSPKPRKPPDATRRIRTFFSRSSIIRSLTVPTSSPARSRALRPRTSSAGSATVRCESLSLSNVAVAVSCLAMIVAPVLFGAGDCPAAPHCYH